MKVTNEQAMCDSDCHTVLFCTDCRYFGDCNQGSAEIQDYASDLLEARTQRDELLAALKALNGWIVVEAEHFEAAMPDDFIMDMVNKALAVSVIKQSLITK